MPTPSDRALKIFSKIREDPQLKEPDLLLIKNSTHPHVDLTFFYISLLDAGLFEGCSLIATREGEVYLYTSKLEEPIAKKGEGYKLRTFSTRQELVELMRRDFPDSYRIGFNGQEITYRGYEEVKSAFKGSQLLDVGQALAKARMVKDEEELARIRRACEVASEAFQEVLEELKEGLREEEVAARLNYIMEGKGCRSAFEPIVAFGANSAEPHYSPRDERLKKGDLVLLDFGAKYRLYCSDLTRTLVLGEPSELQTRMHEVVREAQSIGIRAVKAGALAKEVHKAVAEYIDSTEFKGRFIHSTGHSLGLSVHDGAVLHAQSDLRLEEGMVFTIEPGVYLPRVGGIRIEDDVVVRASGCEILTKAPRELIALRQG